MDIESAKYLWDQMSVSGIQGRLPVDIAEEMVGRGMIASVDEAYVMIGVWTDMGACSFGVSLRTAWREPGTPFPDYQALADRLIRLTELLEEQGAKEGAAVST